MDKDIQAVKEAHRVFYEAFESLDIHQMDAVWLKADYVKCVHPGWDIRVGWPAVRDSWVLIFNHTYEIRFSVCLLDVIIRKNLAWTVCKETISTQDKGKWLDGQIVATNLYERSDEGWGLIHHHGSPLLSQDQGQDQGIETPSE